MLNTAGSYEFGSFTDNKKELARLKRQATLALDFERQIWKQAGLEPGMKVLDLACGPGWTGCELARAVAPGEVIGVDLSQDLLTEGARMLEKEPIDNLSLRWGDIYELEFAEATFDFVYARLLFQHLQAPELALVNILRVLRPGGRLCVVDVDDDWLTLNPAPASFRTFVRWASQGQRRRGGDRSVGRKLGGYLANAGFADVRQDVHVITSEDVGLETFLDITVGFKQEQVPAQHRAFANQALVEIYAVLDAPHAWGAVGAFVATGSRPFSLISDEKPKTRSFWGLGPHR